MPYVPTYQSNIAQATTAVDSANLSNSMFIDTNAYHKARVTSYTTKAEVDADKAVPKDSSLYKALNHAFAQPGGAVPIYCGRRQIDTIIFEPTLVKDNEDYTFEIKTYDETTNLETSTHVITINSGVGATASGIVTALDAAVTAAGVNVSDWSSVVAVDTLVVTPASNRLLVVINSDNLSQSFTSTETAAETYAAITAENNDDWYYCHSSMRDIDWVLDLCAQIQATENSDKKKIFRTSSSAIETLVAQPDPSNVSDLLGRMEDAELTRCAGEWHDQTEELYPELAVSVYQGNPGWSPGTQTFKYMPGLTTPAARHPVLGRLLTTAEQGFIEDRQGSHASKERGVTIYRGGEMAKGSGSWIDNQIATDWINDQIEVRGLNILINRAQGGNPITFKPNHREVLLASVNSVLTEAVERNILQGFVPASAPDNISFQDQAGRIYKDVTWEGYFAGKIHFVIVNGVLTYNEEF